MPLKIRDRMSNILNFVETMVTNTTNVSSVMQVNKQVMVVTLNVQICMKEKTRALHAMLKDLQFPDSVFLQEIGQIPDDFIFTPCT